MLKLAKTNKKKTISVHKQFSSAKYFDDILELKILLFCSETTQGLVSIPISIRDGS